MTGINHYIEDALKRFNNKLWTDKVRKFYGLGRIDINENIPFVRKGKEYIDVLFDDRYDATLFFYEPEQRDVENYAFTTQVNIIFQLWIDRFSDNEEELIQNAYEVIKPTSFQVDSISKDIAAIEEFEYQSRIKDTMRPWFVFRFETTLNGTLK